MPIYEYVCKKCGQQLEVMHKVGEKPDAACTACGSRRLERQVSAAGFRLSGGGWYETDFKKTGKKNLQGESKPEAKADPKSDVKAEAKSDAKPSAKTGPAASKPGGGEKPGSSTKRAA